jgi:hypothetical protein
LILQAFNRSLILAPEIYGNPWLLKDNEFAKLARIFNLIKSIITYSYRVCVAGEEIRTTCSVTRRR